MNHHLLLLFFSWFFLSLIFFLFCLKSYMYLMFSTSLLPKSSHLSRTIDLWNLKNILRLMHVSAFGGTKPESPRLLHTKRLPQNKMWSSEWQTVNNQTSNTFRIASATDLVPCFPSITTVITLVCACVAWSVLCLWLMHLEQLLRVLSSMPRYFCNRWCRPVCRPCVMAGSSIANAGPSDRSRPLQRPTCKGGCRLLQGPGTSIIFRGLKGWGVRPERRSITCWW